MDKLITWINTHDCGVTPTAVLTPERDAIEVRVLAVHSNGTTSIDRALVKTYAEARDALGY